MESTHLKVCGQPVQVLHIDRETGESLIVFRDHTQRIPTAHLIQIADADSSDLLRLIGVGVGSGFEPQSTMNGSGISDEDELVSFPGVGLVVKGSIMAEYKPLTVGSLYKEPEERGK